MKHKSLVVLSKIKRPTLETWAFLSYALHGCDGTVSVEEIKHQNLVSNKLRSNFYREEKLKAWAVALCRSVRSDLSSDEVLTLVIRYSKLSCVGVGFFWQKLHELRTLYSFWKHAGNNIRCQGTLYTSCSVKQPQSLCKWHRLGAPLILSHLYFRWALFNSFL